MVFITKIANNCFNLSGQVFSLGGSISCMNPLKYFFSSKGGKYSSFYLIVHQWLQAQGPSSENCLALIISCKHRGQGFQINFQWRPESNIGRVWPDRTRISLHNSLELYFRYSIFKSYNVYLFIYMKYLLIDFLQHRKEW